VRPDLPTGTVTFLFTDIEGSSRHLASLGADRYAAELATHRRIIRAACRANSGVEVDTQGDAFFFAFPTAAGAVEAGSAFTDRLAEGPLRVRVGIHTGTPLLSEEGYVGYDVHLAARVAAAAHGGQVVLTSTTASVLDGRVSLTDLGEHRLKDVPEPIAILQLGSKPFPPLRTIANTNLPRPASRFVGRTRERRALRDMILDGARLVTLAGPGGTGKTRLAISTAADLVPEYRAGVFWVSLASLRDPSLVLDAISATLGAKDPIAVHIAHRTMLLVVDNFEHVIDAAPALTELIEACPNLSVLVTSREVLGVRGEVVFPVPPLESSEAVELFSIRSGLEPDEDIARLCARLDDLPLAIELAAAHTRVMPVVAILERLTSRLDVLKSGRGVDARHRTLRATIEWSHDLLSEDERALFRRLGVFVGGCGLEAAEQIAGADVDVLASLIGKSLVAHRNGR
jgi:class 3 adenylate cyclase